MAWMMWQLRERNPVIQAVLEKDAAKAKTILQGRPELVNEPSHKLGNRSALWYAVALSHDEMVQVLLEHGANPNLKDGMAETPTDLAGSSGLSESNLLFQLVAHGGNPAHTNFYEPPLILAVEQGLKARHSSTNESNKR